MIRCQRVNENNGVCMYNNELILHLFILKTTIYINRVPFLSDKEGLWLGS